MPVKKRELAKRATRAGFVLLKGRGKGSHRVYGHPKPGVPRIILSGKLNDDAAPHEESQVRDAIEAAR